MFQRILLTLHMLDAYVSGQLEIQQIKYIFSTGDKLPYSLRNRVARILLTLH
jgi:hypothetical protein